jgi:hypothetical protein
MNHPAVAGFGDWQWIKNAYFRTNQIHFVKN